MAEISIAIMLDIICPWCYIGKKRLDEAIAETEHSISASYLPFQLNPTMQENGMDRHDYLNGKFGGETSAKQAYAPIYETSKNMGLDMRLDDIKRTPNTLKAHSLLQYMQEQGRLDFGEVLLRAYLCEAMDVGDEAVLQKLAGFESPSIAEIASQYGQAVMESQAEASRANVRGVPFYIINGQYALSGAQPPEAFLQVFKSVTENQ